MDNNAVKNVGIVLAGGIGSRFGAAIPKQYCLIRGKEMIWYTIDAFRRSKLTDAIIIVVDKKQMEDGRIAADYGLTTILGGATRNESFQNALDYIHSTYPNCEKIIENNAACPMITPEIIDDFLTKLDDYDYVNTAYKITDALGSYKDRVANREDFYLIQAPDAYRFKLLYEHFDKESPLCHPAHQLPLSATECRYFGYDDNYKVTYPHDIFIVEQLMELRDKKGE